MRVAMRTLTMSVAVVLICMAQPIHAQADDQLTAIQQRLEERIIPAAMDINGEIVVAGSVVALQKGSLYMCATSAPAAAGAPSNTYKEGKLSAGMFSWNFGLSLMKIDPNSIFMRTYGPGEKFWIVTYYVNKNGIEFKLWTDPDSNNIRYWSWLKISFEKKHIPSPDEVMNTLAEVLTVSPPDGQGDQGSQHMTLSGMYFPQNGGALAGQYFTFFPNTAFILHLKTGTVPGQYLVNGDTLTIRYSNGNTVNVRIQSDRFIGSGGDVWLRKGGALALPSEAASMPEPAPAASPVPTPAPHQYEDVAPPPPPPTPAPTISMGQTKDQVTAAFGAPQRKAAAGPKEIFFYTDLKMKVTFTNGKVSSIE